MVNPSLLTSKGETNGQGKLPADHSLSEDQREWNYDEDLYACGTKET